MMRKVILGLIGILFLMSCNKRTVETNYSVYKPVIMLRKQLVQSIKFITEQKSLDTVTTVHVWRNYLLVGDLYKGISVYSIKNLSAPQQVGFIVIPGLVDFQMKDSLIYANNAVDLVTIKLDLPSGAEQIDRQSNVLASLYPPDNKQVNPEVFRSMPDSAVIVGWQLDSSQLHNAITDSLIFPYKLFALSGDYLYSVYSQYFLVYFVGQGVPQYKGVINPNIGYLERLEVHGGHLLAVSMAEVKSFSLSDNPSLPSQELEFIGVNAGNFFDIKSGEDTSYFFVTSHSNAGYWILENNLRIYNLGQFNQSVLDTNLALSRPYDLNIRDSLLYVCSSGIKVYKFKQGKLSQLNSISTDARKLYFASDTLLVTIGRKQLTIYKVKADQIEPMSHISIVYPWVVQ